MKKESYLKLAKKIIAVKTQEAKKMGISENFGEKELIKFNDKINADDNLTYGEKADLSAYLAEHLRNIEL